jgi:hypothetical protein
MRIPEDERTFLCFFPYNRPVTDLRGCIHSTSIDKQIDEIFHQIRPNIIGSMTFEADLSSDYLSELAFHENNRGTFCALPPSFAILLPVRGDGNALRVSPAVTRLTVYRRPQVRLNMLRTVIRGRCLASVRDLV